MHIMPRIPPNPRIFSRRGNCSATDNISHDCQVDASARLEGGSSKLQCAWKWCIHRRNQVKKILCALKPSVVTVRPNSADMLVDAGVEWTILGHSERRNVYGETSEVWFEFKPTCMHRFV